MTDDCMPLFTEVKIPEEINHPYSVIGNMTEEEYEVWADKFRLAILDLYENGNAPAISAGATFDQILTKLQKFNDLDVTTEKIYTEDDEGRKIYIGFNSWSNAINHWFPEMADVSISRGVRMHLESRSIIGFIKDKDYFIKQTKATIWRDRFKEFKNDPSKPIWPYTRQAIRIGSGNQPVTNIRGTVAKNLYLNTLKDFADKDEVIIYDPSMGWAGRLISCLSASTEDAVRGTKVTYLGTDPNSQIHDRYGKISSFWKQYVDTDCDVNVVPVLSGSENFNEQPEFTEYKGRVNMIYTSPPYFAKERYCQEDSQSFKKFPTYEEWRDGFLAQTFQNMYDLLADDGVIYWNIADLKTGKNKFMPLVADSLECAKNVGLVLDEQYYMLMRNLAGRDTDPAVLANATNMIEFDGKWRKFEPILRFKKA